MNKFRCKYCGVYFTDREYEDLADCGFFAQQPDTCADCADMLNHPPHDYVDLHSDADPGL